MFNPRTRHLRRLRRLRGAVRRWSVLAAGFAGTTAVLVPYQGLGAPDAAWAGLAGASLALAGWRWADLRGLAAQPIPPEPDPAEAGRRARAQLAGIVDRVPAARTALVELRRHGARLGVRGSAAAPLWDRLDRAGAALSGLTDRLGGPGQPAVLEAAAAEPALRDVARRVVDLERVLRVAPEEARPALRSARGALMAQLDAGVTAYERLVTAAAGYLAEDGRVAVEHPATTALEQSAERLRAVSVGLSELRTAPGVAS
ncbi:MAG TPA: hypothetical protein VNV66_02345 [Pilimelia sp.]|nr:hypothetical protein [Pilimelia sp.]